MADTPHRPAVAGPQFPLDDLVEKMCAEARNEAIDAFSETEIAALGDDLWQWASAIPVGETDLRFRTAHNSHYLEISGPDRPFLVDSLLGDCTQLGLSVKALFHPIIELGDDQRLSLIQIHLPPLTEAEQVLLETEIRATLADVTLATSDYHAMRARMHRELERLAASPHVSDEYKTEAIAFLNWLGNEHFVFLGARDYTFHTGEDGAFIPEEPEMVEGSNLGLLRDENRNVLNRGSEPLILDNKIGEFLSQPEPLILAKATLTSRIHRRTACDYVGVKHFGENGQVSGETRFLGLYTSEAYNDSVRNVPLIRKRVARVIEAAGAIKGTHNEKALSNIMEGWPRDELIQTNSETLTPIMLSALHLIGRPRVRLFVRPDRFNRFVSAIVFVPREAYDTALREKISDALEQAFGGRLAGFEPSFDGTGLVRVLFEIALPAKTREPDLKALEDELVELAQTWSERFRNAVMDSDADADARARATLFTGAFNAAYREAFSPEEAMNDVAALSQVSADQPVKLRAFRLPGDDPGTVRAKIYARNGSIALSDCVPVFERMGLFVNFETGYPVSPREKPAGDAPNTYWVHALSMNLTNGRETDLETIAAAFEDAFVAVWSGQAENDGFNALVFNAGLTWREAALCRTLCAYRHQSGLDPARATQIEALNANPALTGALLTLFETRFIPGRPPSDSALVSDLSVAKAAIEEGLKSVSSLDHDRVIRRVSDLISAIQRTNFYQRDSAGLPRPCIAFKIASRELTDLPAPKPFREIFMSSPVVEGVHCRFGPVARGGLRWSDRRDDFRTEVLGLVKAQQVKNAVIVPVGSKGGFFPKQLPAGGTREAIREAGTTAYRTFITALLDLTDNLIDGKVRHPENTMIWDGEDPYLVVAADKGTATFSDTANEISETHGFWLGDAFASGGSVGYDHKKMGITARGAWEAVKRHFREIGKDIQTQPFTTIGCGDMSGDVFGNGMLLSKQTQLVAAFNHMHIFIDPDPQDTERLWAERQRMFDLPRSSWMDFDQSLISEGGGIYERTAKSIELTPQIKSLTGLKQDAVTPDTLIHALLKAECDLLWFGGIGTYIKASDELHDAAGDRGNDRLRVNGKQVRAKVIGEGANLGLTQAGRIEFALSGGRLNSDAIDNSAGVDSSDHEVNIKILCTEAMRRGELAKGERNTLLASMTDQVAAHVLAHNYAQTSALSLAEDSARADHDALERLMVRLEEQRGVLDREVEGLPDSAEMHARSEAGKPLTRPELAVVMAWSKIILCDDLTASDLPDDPYFFDTLQAYFPDALHKYTDPMQAHRLKRDIIATILANRIIDVSGPVFLLRLREQTGADNATITAAFEAARALLDAEALQAQISALDNKVPAARQIALQHTLAGALSNLTESLIKSRGNETIGETISTLSPVIQGLIKDLPGALGTFKAGRLSKTIKSLARDKVPTQLATSIATTHFVCNAPDLADIATDLKADPQQVFATFQSIGETLHLDRLRASAQEALHTMPYWDRLATRRLIRELRSQQSNAVRIALNPDRPDILREAGLNARKQLVADIRTFTANKPGFAQYALAADAVRSFMQSADTQAQT